jgi:1-deoxy-D-xylulose-5-phosphate reductoisomerase
MKKPRNIAILGSTGSIGCSSLEVIANFPDELRVTYLTANKNIDLLQEQTRRFRPRAVVVLEESNASVLREALDGTTEVLVGEEGLQEIVCREDVDIVLSSLVGFAGLTAREDRGPHPSTVNYSFNGGIRRWIDQGPAQRA